MNTTTLAAMKTKSGLTLVCPTDIRLCRRQPVTPLSRQADASARSVERLPVPFTADMTSDLFLGVKMSMRSVA